MTGHQASPAHAGRPAPPAATARPHDPAGHPATGRRRLTPDGHTGDATGAAYESGITVPDDGTLSDRGPDQCLGQ